VTRAFLNAKQYLSVTNVGDNPTFGDEERYIEVHILDFTEDIYGTDLRVEFVQRLREEIKFDSVESLVSQMHVDVNDARAIFERTHD
ncbi:riboflavin kinase, partial [Dehalococcoidia bacterium]|nr:riboflavin kinase [Dehalococcoidia bacterium]